MLEMFDEWFEFFSTILGASIPVSLVGVFFIILLIYKIFRLELEKIFSFLLKFLTLIFKGCKLFQTWYIKFDFQARVNLVVLVKKEKKTYYSSEDQESLEK